MIELIESCGIDISGSINTVSPKFIKVSFPISTVTNLGSIKTILSNTNRHPLASLIRMVLILPDRLVHELMEEKGPLLNEYNIGGAPPSILA